MTDDVVETITSVATVPIATTLTAATNTATTTTTTTSSTTKTLDDILSDSEKTPPLSNRRRRPKKEREKQNTSTGTTISGGGGGENHYTTTGSTEYGSIHNGITTNTSTTGSTNTNHDVNDTKNDNDNDDDDDETDFGNNERLTLLHPNQKQQQQQSTTTNGRWRPRSGGGGSSSNNSTNSNISNSNITNSSNSLRSERSIREHRLNQWLEATIVLLILGMITIGCATYWYYNIHIQHVLKHTYQIAIQTHAKAAQERRQYCYHIDWETACDHLTNPAGARRQLLQQLQQQPQYHHYHDHRNLIMNNDPKSKRKRTSSTNKQQHHYGKNGRSQQNHRSRSRHQSSSSSSSSHNTIIRNTSIPSNEQEEELLQSDDPAVTYDNNCLKVYRLDINHGQMTFPYHSSQLLRLGGNQSMVLIIQHGALRNSEAYFCSFKQMMLQQTYRQFNDILIIAPDFNYATDDLVHPNDAVWNSSKPWGDWRVGAQSDPYGLIDLTIVENDDGTTSTTTTKKATTKNAASRWYSRLFDHTMIRPTISSFDVLDHMLAILTDKRLFPNVDKISFVGHSAGGQMVQRYAILSVLAALWFMDTGKGSIDIEFIIANPSSYTYLDPRRYTYNCGTCTCSTNNCTCDQDCTEQDDNTLQIPKRQDINHHYPERSKFPCYQWNYDRWPYGIGSFTDESDDGTLIHTVPYALRDGFVGVERATRMYRKLNMVYMVGQNDTCNDGLPTCSADCWKRTNYTDEEWSCFRNDMDTRCPAMLQGPYRRARAYQYMKYLELLYGEPVHRLHTIPGVGHNATAMFSSDIALKELFD